MFHMLLAARVIASRLVMTGVGSVCRPQPMPQQPAPILDLSLQIILLRHMGRPRPTRQRRVPILELCRQVTLLLHTLRRRPMRQRPSPILDLSLQVTLLRRMRRLRHMRQQPAPIPELGLLVAPLRRILRRRRPHRFLQVLSTVCPARPVPPTLQCPHTHHRRLPRQVRPRPRTRHLFHIPRLLWRRQQWR
jgi:hypothetical protein